MNNDPPITMQRKTLTIEGERNLHSYTFSDTNSQDRLTRMIEAQEIGVLAPFLAQHASALDLRQALEIARAVSNEEATKLLEARLEADGG